MICLYILEIRPLVASFANIFSQSVGCLLFCYISFAVQNLVNLIMSCLSIFAPRAIFGSEVEELVESNAY